MKKEGLTLAKLASYDDLLTDALVDRIYFWATIRKNRTRYAACRGIREEDITGVLRSTIVIEKDAIKACAQLLGLPGLKRFHDRLLLDEREHFQRHLRKYVSIYLPDCPFEVITTNRYTIDTAEAAVVARKVIQKGELIRYLSGVQVPITKEEEQDLDLTRRDFSIVMSSRKRTPSLFLGPARFANHDCDANARLTTRGSSGMAVVAAKDIDIGEEITVSYGDDYFGINNCECLCHTCEELLRNGWAPSLAQSIETSLPHSDQDMQYTRDRRLHGMSQSTPSGAASPRIEADSSKTNASRKRKLHDRHNSDTKADRVEAALAEDHDLAYTSTQLHHPLNLAQQMLTHNDVWNHSQEQTSTPGRSISPISALESSQWASSISYASTAATSMSEHTPAPKEESAEKETIRPMDLFPTALTTAAAGKVSLMPLEPVAPNGDQNEAEASESELSDLPDGVRFDDNLQQLVAVKGPTQLRVTRRTLASLPRKEKHLLLAVHGGENLPSETELVTVSENARKPGDYTLTSRLLAAPHSRWGSCRVCDDHFIQTEANLTRWSCPRCERHSKLYGYQWPKTDKAGKHDLEERVMDHREIHRYIWSNEEKTLKKGRKSATEMLKEMIEQEKHASGSALSSADERGSETPRTRRPAGRFREAASSTESPTPRKRKVVKEAVATPAKKAKLTDTIYDFPATPYQSPSHKAARSSPLKYANCTSRAATKDIKQERRQTIKTKSKENTVVEPATRLLQSKIVDAVELSVLRTGRHAARKNCSTSSKAEYTELDFIHGRPTTADISEISDSAPSFPLHTGGVLKRPARKASMGIAAAVAAEMDSFEADRHTPRKQKVRPVGRI